MWNRKKRDKNIFVDYERERHLKKEKAARKKKLELDEMGPTDDELDELVKRFPAPREWYEEEHG